MIAANAHVIERQATLMNRELGAVWRGEKGIEEVGKIEAKFGFRHGWFFDELHNAVFQNHGGRGIVWVDQPVLD